MRAYVQPVIGGFLNGVVPGQCKFVRDHSERWFFFFTLALLLLFIFSHMIGAFFFFQFSF